MKIGPINLSLSRKPDAELAQSPSVSPIQSPPVYSDPSIKSEDIKYDPTISMGATGTVFFSGIITGEEYNPDLATPEQFLPIYDKMYKSHGQVRAIMDVLMLPLIEADWSIKAASLDAEDKAIGQFVQDNLFHGMQRSWHETLGFILLEMLRDGFAVLEKVWARGDDGQTRYAKLAPRLSKTIYRWYPNDNDELDRIQQRVYRVNADGLTGQYWYPVIPANKLVVFTHRQEGNNFQGVSVLRAAYRHWYYLDQLERIDAIAAERGGVGIPVMIEPPGGPKQKSDRDIAANVLASLHAHEKTYVLVPDGWKFEMVVPGHGRDIISSIQYHNMMIARSVLAQFINLDRGGSYALSMDISTFFLQALHSVARYLRDVFNRDVIRPLVDLNFQTDRYPTLEVGDLDKRDIDRYLMGLGRVLPFLTMNAETENALRADLGLPDLPPQADGIGGGQPTVDTDSQGKVATPQGQHGPAAPGVPPPPVGRDGRLQPRAVPPNRSSGDPVPAEAEYSQRLDAALATVARMRTADTEHTARSASLAPLSAVMDQGLARWERDVAPVVDRQIGSLARVAGKFVERGEPVEPDKVDIPYRGQLAQAIQGVMAQQYRAGHADVTARARLVRERSLSDAYDDAGQGDASGTPVWALPEEQVQRVVGVKAKSLAAIIGAGLLAAYGTVANDQADLATWDERHFTERVGRQLGRSLVRHAGTAVRGVLALGRAQAARQTGARIATYVAMDDDATCNSCADLDGASFVVGSADYDAAMPPNGDCSGGDRCRCGYEYSYE